MQTAPILLAISFVLTFSFSYAPPAPVQQKAEQEVLSPLTEEERLLNARDLILNQPDFMADLSFFVAHRVSGHGFSQKLVRKGNQLVQPNRSTIQKLTNISLKVPDSRVHIPPDYKSIEHDRWTKLENAIVTCKGKPAEDATVFRSPGGHLFIRVNDWSYLVGPKEAIVDTAFRGLLVTKTGQFVWETEDKEGYSAIAYKEPRPSKWDNPEDRKVTVAPSSVTFRATDYERSKAIIQVRW